MKKKVEKDRKNIKLNIIFVVAIIIFLAIIVFISLNIEKKDDNKVFSFSTSEFQNITAIGIYEYQASFNYEGTSIVLFCNNEKEECFDEVSILNSIGSKYGVGFEYINILELVDEEKEKLKEISDIFDDDYYPNLVIIKNGEIVNNSNTYLNEEEVIYLLIEHGIIE